MGSLQRFPAGTLSQSEIERMAGTEKTRNAINEYIQSLKDKASIKIRGREI